MTDDLKPGPGEARNRKRLLRQALYFAGAIVIGILIGFGTGFSDDGEGDLFGGGWAELSIDPSLAVILAIGLFIGFFLLPLWGFRLIDDFKREHNYIGFTAGSLCVGAGFPIWAMLHAGGFVRQPDAFDIWIIGFAGMSLGYLYARFLR